MMPSESTGPTEKISSTYVARPRFSVNAPEFLSSSPSPQPSLSFSERTDDSDERAFDPSAICQFWRAGNCKYGRRCRHRHSYDNMDVNSSQSTPRSGRSSQMYIPAVYDGYTDMGMYGPGMPALPMQQMYNMGGYPVPVPMYDFVPTVYPPVPVPMNFMPAPVAPTHISMPMSNPVELSQQPESVAVPSVVAPDPEKTEADATPVKSSPRQRKERTPKQSKPVAKPEAPKESEEERAKREAELDAKIAAVREANAKREQRAKEVIADQLRFEETAARERKAYHERRKQQRQKGAEK